jgi:riboflavin kinase/FMN adenylyltransferase
MKIVCGLEKSQFRKKRNVITIGSFDGIHIGHRAILHRMLEVVPRYKGRSVVITFDPLPKEFFSGGDFKVLMTREEKTDELKEIGIEEICIIPFTKEFSVIDASEFLEKIWDNFRPAAIAFGHNHHFGKDGKGGVTLLKDYSERKGFDLFEIEEVRIGKSAVSSSRIREFILEGEMRRANEMLGRPFFFSGSVQKGDGVGRSLSYPTANLRLDDEKKILPKDGVYAARAIHDSQEFSAMLYIGTRPTFTDSLQRTCELYMMNYDGDLYGNTLKISVLDRIRDERKFRSSRILRRQIVDDEKNARRIINSRINQGG